MYPKQLKSFFYTDKDIYKKENYTEKEINNTLIIKKEILNFLRIINENPNYQNNILEKFYDGWSWYPEEVIYYNDNYGYIAKTNPDRGMIYVYLYGRTYEEAFMKIVYEEVTERSNHYEAFNREKLKEKFSNRFNNEYDYNGSFYYVECCLQLLSMYYGKAIPKEFIQVFNLDRFDYLNVEYNYETNRFERIKEKSLTRKRSDKNDQEKIRSYR